MASFLPDPAYNALSTTCMTCKALGTCHVLSNTQYFQKIFSVPFFVMDTYSIRYCAWQKYMHGTLSAPVVPLILL